MRRPTIRLGYVLELIAAAALCFGFVRWSLSSGGFLSFLSDAQVRSSDWVRLVGGPLLSGLALSGGVGLIVETARGRSPSTWGLGRWIWSISGLYLVLNTAQIAVSAAVARLAHGMEWLGFARSSLFERIVIHEFFGGFAWAIAAVCTTAMIARSPRDPEPDAREWAGRVFASLAVALNIAEPLLRATGR
jgi:hypothetical protein